MKVVAGDDRLLVDISDALSERDRVRFTVHTRTKLPQFAKPVMSVVRQHEEFIWLHDCLEDNDQYAGYIIPPPPPKPDFDASREKLQRLGDGEANMTKEEFAKMKQELEAEYLAIFKKTVAMHEIFLQRLAAHDKFREDNNFKIFLEYENELAVRCKSKKERLAGSIQNIGKSLTDFVITTSQVAATTSAGTSILAGHSPSRQQSALNNNRHQMATSNSIDQLHSNTSNNSTMTCDTGGDSHGVVSSSTTTSTTTTSSGNKVKIDDNNSNDNNSNEAATGGGSDPRREQTSNLNNNNNSNNNNGDDVDDVNNINVDDEINEQYFEKERLYLALYHNSIRETAIQADKVVQLQKAVANNYLHIAQQLVKLAGIEVMPITSQTKDLSSFVACPLPSLTMPTSMSISTSLYNNNNNNNNNNTIITSQSDHQLPSSSGSSSNSKVHLKGSAKLDNDAGEDNDENNVHVDDDDDDFLNSVDLNTPSSSSTSANNNQQSDKPSTQAGKTLQLATTGASKNVVAGGGCANNHTSEGLKQLLLHVSDYLEQARKVEMRIASDEDLKLTDIFIYYKRETVAAQDLLMRRLRFMADYETATRNLEKARQKGRTQMQYAAVIQKQAKENFINISKLAKQEIIDYKQRRVTSFKRTFADLVDLELKHLRLHSHLIANCLNTCRGMAPQNNNIK